MSVETYLYDRGYDGKDISGYDRNITGYDTTKSCTGDRQIHHHRCDLYSHLIFSSFNL